MASSSSIFRREGGDRFAERMEPYQDRAIRFALGQAAAGIFLVPGLGKTAITYATISVLRERGLITAALVVAPLRPAYQVWPAERDKWEDFRHLRVEVLHGEGKDAAAHREADVYVVNPEGLRWLLEEARPAWLDGAALVVDESTRFKNSQGKRFKLLRRHLGRFHRRYILTGTPRPRSLEDLFAQVYLLDQGNSLGRYVSHFRQTWFVPGGFQGREWTPRPGAEEEIYGRIAPLVLHLGEEYLDLPPIVDVPPVEVELPPAARRAYDELERELVAELEAGEVVAANAAAKTSKLRQVANGGVYTDDQGHFEHLHRAKAEAVAELVESFQGQPVLVAYDTKHDLARLKEALGDPPHLGGGVSGKRGQELEERWNRGELPVLLVQPASVAHGLNLQAAGQALIWHSLTYNYEDYDQLVRRLWRKGRELRVFRYHVLARDTVDAAVWRSLQTKASGQEGFFDALRRYYLEGERSLSKGFTNDGEGDRVVPDDQPQRSNEEDVAMQEQDKQFTEGQRVRLPEDPAEGLPEEYGYVVDQEDADTVVVRVDEAYRDSSEEPDDGLREVPPADLEVVEEAEPEAEAEDDAAAAATATAYLVNNNRMTVVGRYRHADAETVARHYEATRSGQHYTVVPEEPEAFADVLGTFDGNALVKLHNKLVGTKQAVSKFPSKKKGIERVGKALEAIGMDVEEELPVAEPKTEPKQAEQPEQTEQPEQEQPKAKSSKQGGGKAQQPAASDGSKGGGAKKPKGPEPEALVDHLPKSFPKPQEGEKSGQYIRRLIGMEAYSDEVICAASLAFLGGKTKTKDVQWNRSKLRREGEHAPERMAFGEGKGERQLAKKAGIELGG